jgi:diacylglycerol kinase (ATP)
MSTLFLINPGSGRKRDSENTADLIHKTYQKANCEVWVELIDFQRLDETLAEAEKRGICNVYAVGGDGTVNAIGSRLRNKSMRLGIIPRGSGNGFARNLGFSVNVKLAIRQSLAPRSLLVDTGLLNDIPFLNVAGVGLDAEVARLFSMGKQRGFAPYVKSTTEGLLKYQPRDYQVAIDGETHYFEQIVGIIIANGTQWGYDATITPHASLNDGFLDVLVVHKFPLVKVGLIVSKMFRGRFPDSNYASVFQAKEIDIFRQEAGPAQVDGEPFEAKPNLSIRILERSLHLLLPNTLTPEKIQSL